jgi:hypothetical protein
MLARSRRRENYSSISNNRWFARVLNGRIIPQDAQNGIPARPQGSGGAVNIASVVSSEFFLVRIFGRSLGGSNWWAIDSRT